MPCTACIQRASNQSGDDDIAHPELCFACKATLAKLAVQRERDQPLSHSSHLMLLALSRADQDTTCHADMIAEKRPTRDNTATNDQQRNPSVWHASDPSGSLSRLTRKFVDVVNERDFLNPIWYQAAIGIEVEALDNFHPTTTLAENIRTFKTIARQSPQYRLHVRGIDILEAKDGLTAESYINMQVTGRPEGLVMNSIGRMQWRRHCQTWLLTSFTAMRFSDPL